MASFGSFETERELASTANATVFLARQRGAPAGGGTASVVKLFPPDSAVDAGALSFGETSFLRSPTASPASPGTGTGNQASAHVRLAALSEHVLPVIEQGNDERGQWLTTAFCPLSAHRLVAGKVTLPAETFHRLFAAVVRALAALKSTAGRSHGNLKATNVLLTSADVREARVLLSDPAPDGPPAEVHELADLRSLGLLLYQLVFRREITDNADWLVVPVEMSREWTAQFGPAARGWLDLCNQLLDRHGSLEKFHLGSVVDALPGLAPKPAVSRRALILTATVVLVAGAAAMFLAWRQRFTTLQITSDPPGATMTLDGTDVGRAGPPAQPWKLRVRKGEHRLVATVPGLDDLKRDLHLTNQTASIHLPFEFASLELQTEPPGAAVEVESGEAGPTRPLQLPDGGPAITPCRLPFLRPGALRLRFVRDKYETFPVETNLVVRQSLPLLVRLKERIPGQVEVKFQLTPEDVSIVDEAGGVRVERTGAIRYLSPRRYQLVAKYPGWTRTLTNAFEVTAGMGSTNFEFRFPNTRVTFALEPEDTTILADGRVLNLNRSYEHFPTGPIRFMFMRRGYKTNVMDRVLEDRVPVTLPVTLEALGGLFTFRSRLWPVDVTEGNQVLGRITGGEARGFTTVLKEGAHTVTARYGDLLEASLSVVATNGVEVVGQFDFDFGVGRFASDPAGAEFYWRRGDRRIKLDEASVFPIGTNEIEAVLPQKPLLRPVRQAIQVRKEATNLFSFPFEFASLVLTSHPPVGPEVLQGGKVIDRTPFRLQDLPFGRIEYQLRWEGRIVPVVFNLNARGVFTNGANCELPLRYTNSLNMVYVLSPSGGYYVAEFEVRQREFTNVVTLSDAQRNNLKENPNMPMTYVGWDAAAAFCQALTERDRPALARAFGPSVRFQYALPSEADWMTAAPTNADCLVQSILSTSGVQPVATGRASSNSFGVFDLLGNVSEWCHGTDGSRLTVGGFYANLRPKVVTANFLEKMKVRQNAQTIAAGTDDIGFRCFLKP